MKITQLTLIILTTWSLPISANCLYENKLYPIGYELAIDNDFPAKQNRQYVWVSSSLNYEASKYQEGE